MIYVSYFGKAKSKPLHQVKSVSIANSRPPGCYYPKITALVPPWDIVKAFKDNKITWEEFVKQYTERVLNHCDPYELAKELDEKILCCWEKDFNRCHRSLVRRWFKKHNIQCKELDYELEEKYWLK